MLKSSLFCMGQEMKGAYISSLHLLAGRRDGESKKRGKGVFHYLILLAKCLGGKSSKARSSGFAAGDFR